jgi:hypothetical protein
MSDLRDFARGATEAMGFGSEPTDVNEQEVGVEDEAQSEGGAAGNDAYQELAASFWDELGDEDREAAEQSVVARERLWVSFLEARGLAVDDQDDQEADDAEGIDPGSGGFASANDLIAAVLNGEAELSTSEGDPLTPAEWLRWAAEAPEREWVEAARAVGWDPRIRPSHNLINQFGRGAQGAVFAESWAAHLDRVRRSGRHLGQ